jgi:hypothetical protein
MARLARAVFAGVPHHVTQRGNGRAQTFFADEDYQLYRDLLAEHAREAGVRRAESIGRPLGDDAFLAAPERDSGRPLMRAKPGPRAKISGLSP